MASKYVCPLCHQPVPSSLYEKIVGVWAERNRIAQKMHDQLDKLKKDRKEFQRKKARLISAAVSKKIKSADKKIRELKLKETRLDRYYTRKIQRMLVDSHKREEKLEKRYKNLGKDQVKNAVSKATLEVQRKYTREKRSMGSLIFQLQRRDIQSRDEIQRLKKELAENATPQLEGFIYESELLKELKKRFPNDKFQHPGKAGDIIQIVINEKKEVGRILYECKRVKHYASKHIKQALEAKHKRNAQFAILVTNAMKKGTHGFFVEKTVIVVHAAGVIFMADILRRQVIELARMRLGKSEKDKIIRGVLGYMEGQEFENSIDLIIQDSIILAEQLRDEMRKHIKNWKERYSLYSKINSEAKVIQSNTKNLLSGKPLEKEKVSNLPAMPVLPEVEDEKEKTKESE